MTKNSLETELQLLAECVSFAIKWLCWRKWLRVHGILAWSLNGLQIKTDEGQFAPVYRYEESWKKYFSSLAMQRNVTFTHFSMNHRRQNVTGEALQVLMIREQRMWAIEREWCRLNSDTIFKHPLLNSPKHIEKTDRPDEEIPQMPLSSRDGYIDNTAMVDFYQRLCCRLAEVIGTKPPQIKFSTTPPSKSYPVTIRAEGEKATPPTW